MLHVLLLILKIIGIVILVLLALVLSLLLVVLLVPIRYRIQIEHGNQLKVEGMGSWLMHLLHAKITFMDSKLKIWVKVLGFTLYDKDKPSTLKHKGKKSRKRHKGIKKVIKTKSIGKIKAIDKEIDIAIDKEIDRIKSIDETSVDILKRSDDVQTIPNETYVTPSDNVSKELMHNPDTHQEMVQIKKEETIEKDYQNNEYKEKEYQEKEYQENVYLGQDTFIKQEKDKQEEGIQEEGIQEEDIQEGIQEDIQEEDIQKDDTQEDIQKEDKRKEERDKKKKRFHLKEKIQEIIKKIKSFFERLKERIKNWYQATININRIRNLIIEFLNEEQNKEGLKTTLLSIKKLLKHILPTKVKSKVIFGTGDPCSTGQALGVMGILFSVYGDNIRIIPDFEEKRFEGQHDIKGRIRMLTLIIIVLKLILDKRFKELKRNLIILKEAL